MATNTCYATVGMDVAKAIRIAISGRPGPVHLSLPSDVLDASVPESAIVWPTDKDFADRLVTLSDPAAEAMLSAIHARATPVVAGR